MAGILRISEAATLALHTMSFMVESRGKKVTTEFMATAMHASRAHLHKVLQRLAKVGLVKSIRGIGGGFMLARDPKEITLLNVFEAIEGPFVPSTCLMDTPICDGNCILGDLLTDINRQVKEHLAGKRLDQLKGLFSCVMSADPEPAPDENKADARGQSQAI